MSGAQNDGNRGVDAFSLTQISRAALRVWWLGWVDGLRDRPYPFRYDQWREVEQVQYEFGRLNAANVRSANITIPLWDGNHAGAGLVSRAVRKAETRVGTATSSTAKEGPR